MRTLAGALSFDSTGQALHRGDTAFLVAKGDVYSDGDSFTAVEIYDVVNPNEVAYIDPDSGAVIVCNSTELTRIDPKSETVKHFDSDPIQGMSESSEMGRVRLVTPVYDQLDQVADLINKMMKEVSKTVLPIQKKISGVRHGRVSASGMVEEGSVQAEIQVADYMMKRKGTVILEFPIKNGVVIKPFGFRISSGAVYPWTSGALKKWLKIPDVPYIGKRSPGATISGVRD